MPELPEVETIVRQLDTVLRGSVFGEVVHLRSDMVRGADRSLRRVLPGQRITRVYRRAKRVVFELEEPGNEATEPRRPEATKRRGLEGAHLPRSPSLQLVVHLGMTGRLMMCGVQEPIEKHTHFRVAIQGTNRELRFRDPRRFGGIWVLSQATKARRHEGTKEGTKERRGPGTTRANRQSTLDNRQFRQSPNRQITRSRNRDLGPVGPEPLDLGAAEFRHVLKRKRQIKALLMDQTAIAGLGNIYCDESLHAAGIHPLTPAEALTTAQAGRLLRAIKSILRRAIRYAGSTFMDYRSADGEPGSFQRFHRVYAREGEPCGTCKTPITRIQAAGRSTFYCPNCQPPNRGARNRRPGAGRSR